MSPRYERLLHMLAEQPDDDFLQYAKAMEERKLGRPAEAAATLSTLLRRNPDYVGGYFHLAALHAELADTVATEQTYRTGIEVAQRVGDQHALAELRNAYVNWQLEV